MVYSILEEGPWKHQQESSSRSPKTDFLFPHGPAKPRKVVFSISNYFRFVTPLMIFMEGKEALWCLGCRMRWQGINYHWPFSL